jgi:hypothetical protein
MNEDQPDDAPVGATAPAPDGPLPPPGEAHDHHIPQAATPPLAGGRQPYAQAPLPAQLSAPEGPRNPVTVPQGTLLQLRTNEFLDSKHAKDGAQVEFTVIHDVVFGGALAIPRGATAHGVVTETKQPGALTGSPELALKLTSIDLGGQSYDIQTDEFKVKGPGKGGQTAGNVFGGAILGAIIGGAAGGGPGAAIGAAAGGGAGTVASAASSGPRVWIPAEALVDFHLAAPATVTPVDRQEAARLAQGLNQGGPSLYRRGYAPYGRPYVAAYGYPYGYPYGYYRPYYIVGGFHYWR